MSPWCKVWSAEAYLLGVAVVTMLESKSSPDIHPTGLLT